MSADIDELIQKLDDLPKLINKGTGAGGANTNMNGLAYENKTSIETVLIKNNYKKYIFNKTKCGYYYKCDLSDKITVMYFTQSGLKNYFKKKYNIEIHRNPDEAFLIKNDGNYILKILEKKNQNTEGSVEDKLKTGCFNRREYELMIGDIIDNCPIKIEYAFSISKFLQDKFTSTINKYIIMKKIMDEDNIKIFYGNDSDYFDKIIKWISE